MAVHWGGRGRGHSSRQSTAGASVTALGYNAVLLTMGDSQARGTADDATTGGWVPTSKVKIRTAAGAWVNYNPGVAGASGVEFAGDTDTGFSFELEFARQFVAKYPNDTLYIIKETASGSFQGRGISTGTATVSVTNPNALTVNSGTVNAGDLLVGTGLVNNDGKSLYEPFSGYVSAVNSGSNANVATVASVAATRYNAYLSWSSTDGLQYNGSSNSITNGARARIAAALASLTNAKVIAVGVSLGSNDAVSTTTAGEYQAATTAFLARLRSDFGTLSGIPIIATRTAAGGTGLSTVQAAQAAVASGDTLYMPIDMTGQPINSGDSIHWRQAGLNYFGGQLFANISTSYTAVAPSFSVAPVMTNPSVQQGYVVQGQTLTCTSGTFSGTLTPAATYQWYAGGVAISGATSSSYTVQASDDGNAITCTVTATNGAGSATSTAVLAPVAIAGTLRLNDPLSSQGSWSFLTGVTYTGGKMVFTNVAANNSVGQALTMTAGKTLRIISDMTFTGGAQAKYLLGGATFPNGATHSTNGTFVDDIVIPASPTQIFIQTATANFNGTVDNVLVVERP